VTVANFYKRRLFWELVAEEGSQEAVSFSNVLAKRHKRALKYLKDFKCNRVEKPK
ncbi:unnamed protein product, partial [Brassica rapa subsp. trilocularis]